MIQVWEVAAADPSRVSEASEAWRFEGSKSCTFRLIGSHMAGSTWLKLAGLVQGNSVTDMGYVRGGMIHDSWYIEWDTLCLKFNKSIYKLWINSCFMTPGSPLGAVYAPLVVRFRPGHLNMTHENHKGWYQQPEDHFEAVWRCYCKAPSKNGWFLGVVEKPPIMACMFLQCQDMVRTCYRS